jgi:hypothetical protein
LPGISSTRTRPRRPDSGSTLAALEAARSGASIAVLCSLPRRQLQIGQREPGMSLGYALEAAINGSQVPTPRCRTGSNAPSLAIVDPGRPTGRASGGRGSACVGLCAEPSPLVSSSPVSGRCARCRRQ